MHTPIRSRKSARTATIAAQAAALVLVISGGVMAFTDLPGLKVSEEAGEPRPAPDAGGQSGGPGVGAGRTYAASVDPETVDAMLGMIKNRPVPDEPVEGGSEGDDLPPDPAPDTSVRYVGSIRVGGRAAAFMNIGGITKLLRPGGAEYEGVRLVSVDDDRVVVSIDGRAEQEIEKTRRSGPAVSVVVGGAPAPERDPTAVADESPQAPTFTPDMSREERRQALLERARSERGRWERQRGDGGGPPNP